MPDKRHSTEIISDIMPDRTFLRFSAFIRAELGIDMSPAKKMMLQACLQKRLRVLGMKAFDDYYEYVFSSQGINAELPHMIDVITTNKTDFFREPRQFEYLTQAILPAFLKSSAKGSGKQLKVWCAGCSTGEEAYTLAMVLNEFAEQHSGFQYSILATDISTRVLEKGESGVYQREKTEPIPLELREKYLLQSKDRNRQLVRIVPELRSRVTFQRLNLNAKDFDMRKNLDIIFCRNVIIYFNKDTQQAILESLCDHLKSEGYFFMGPSETLNGLNLPLTPVMHAVYQKTDMPAEDAKLPRIILNSAELYVSPTPAIVKTVLGSCVAVTMFNRRRGIGAICHALLPHPRDNKPYTANYAENRKYVTYVIPEMIREMQQYDIQLREIEVKLFGGSDTLNEKTGQESGRSAGRLNVKTVMEVLEAQRLQLKTSDVGGIRGRKILFYTHTGEVLLKRLNDVE